LAGKLAILIADRLLAGESAGSVIGKSNVLKAYGVLRFVLTTRSAPTGASLTAVTPIARVFGDWSRSTPPLAVPPLSCTWKVKLVYGEPLALAAGRKRKLPAVISLAAMNWPAKTAMPLLISVPLLGSAVTRTAFSVLAGLSSVSLKPKLAAVNVSAVSSSVV